MFRRVFLESNRAPRLLKLSCFYYNVFYRIFQVFLEKIFKNFHLFTRKSEKAVFRKVFSDFPILTNMRKDCAVNPMKFAGKEQISKFGWGRVATNDFGKGSIAKMTRIGFF